MAGCGKPCACPSYRDHVASVAVAASAMPSRKAEVVRLESKEAAFDQDATSYRRIRRAGLQPDHVDGSRQLERSLGG